MRLRADTISTISRVAARPRAPQRTVTVDRGTSQWRGPDTQGGSLARAWNLYIWSPRHGRRRETSSTSPVRPVGRDGRLFHPEETAYGRSEIAHLQGLLATHAHAGPDSRSALAPVEDVRHQGEPDEPERVHDLRDYV